MSQRKLWRRRRQGGPPIAEHTLRHRRRAATEELTARGNEQGAGQTGRPLGSIDRRLRGPGQQAGSVGHGGAPGRCAPLLGVQGAGPPHERFEHECGGGQSAETRVVSTASWTPPHSGKPLAMTSRRRSSWWAATTVRSRSRMLVATVAPASRQTLAAACSKGTPLGRKSPARGQAAQWSP